jgi:hypothetical protein
MRTVALLVLAAAGFAPASFAAVYTCTDTDGRTVFRDLPCPRGERRVEVNEATSEPSFPKKKKKEARGEQPLERAQVERVVARLDLAMGKRDTKAVMALLAKEAVVELQAGVETDAGLDRVGYQSYLVRVFAAPDYVYRATPARISLSKSKPRANVTRTIRESMLVNGQPEVVEVKERLTIEPQSRGLRIRQLRKVVRTAGQ